MKRRNLNDVVDELLASQEIKLRTKTKEYIQIIEQQKERQGGKPVQNIRLKRRRGQELSDLIDELDLQTNINTNIKEILVKNSLINQGEKPVVGTIQDSKATMNRKITKLDFMSSTPISNEMPIREIETDLLSVLLEEN